MNPLHSELFSWLACRFRGRVELELEVIALRHQLAVLRRQRPARARLCPVDRLISVWLYRVWRDVKAHNLPAEARVRAIVVELTEAFPWDEAPQHLIRDRDGAYGSAYMRRLHAMGIRDHPTAARSPWQNGHVERLIGSIRRDCLDHIVVVGEAQGLTNFGAISRTW